MAARHFLSVDFEVFGKVQGVFFRKYTNETAAKYGLVGWVKNTPSDTVVGTIQGEEAPIRSMKQWLSKTGSPKSRIDKCEFRNERQLSETEYSDFGIEPGNNKKRKKKSGAGPSKPTSKK